MSIEERVTKRISDLIASGRGLSVGDPEYGLCRDGGQMAACVGWVAAAQHAVSLVCPNAGSAYRLRAEDIASRAVQSGGVVNARVGELVSLLINLVDEITAGLLTSVANQARAETFDDFLDHADAYAKEERQNEAGVISGVVFEDTIRRVCRDHGIPEAEAKLDDLISHLARDDVITASEAKRARAAAHVRTKATHAQWDEFSLDDVKAASAFTRQLIAEHLEA